MAKRQILQHYRTTTTNKPNDLEYGELAVAYGKGNEALYIKNSSNQILTFQPAEHKVIPITYSKLVALKDEGELAAGQYYRITDYVTTVANDPEARSAGHQFDIIVLALNDRSLSERAWATLHDGDDYFSEYGARLEAWQLWYTIDNDDTKHAWADTENGKGVIYRMIDEHMNDCPYDFKNIQFKRYAVTEIWNDDQKLSTEAFNYLSSTFVKSQNGGKYFGSHDLHYGSLPHNLHPKLDTNDYTWYYTFHGLGSNDGNTISFEYDMSTYHIRLPEECINFLIEDYSGSDLEDTCYNNIILPCGLEFMEDGIYHSGRYVLNNIVFINGLSYAYRTNGLYWERSISVCIGNRFGVDCYSNTFGNICYNNTFGNYCFRNTFGNDCRSNTFGNSCYNNTFGNYCYDNTFGNDCGSNTFGNSCSSNFFGNNCYHNTFGHSCYSNTFGNNYSYNTLGNICSNNIFGNSCSSNFFGNNCGNNTFGNSFYENILGNYFHYNTFGNYCSTLTFGKWTFTDLILTNYIQKLTIFDGVQYCNINTNDTTSTTKYLKNCQILNGIQGISAQRKDILFDADKKYTQIAGMDIDGETVKTWIAGSIN